MICDTYFISVMTHHSYIDMTPVWINVMKSVGCLFWQVTWNSVAVKWSSITYGIYIYICCDSYYSPLYMICWQKYQFVLIQYIFVGVLQKRKFEGGLTIDRYTWGYRRNSNLADFLSVHEIISHFASVIRYSTHEIISHFASVSTH